MIDILLATYNGERFLGEQIDSLLAQTAQDWRLLIRDDGSTDRTVAICRQYEARFAGKIRVLEDNLGRLKVPGSYGELLRQSTGDYAMFCDQDDVWIPEKIQKTFAVMRGIEQETGVGVPVLVHTDSRVCNENLEPIANSLLEYLHRTPNLPLNRLCVENPVYGHTVIMNKPLRDLFTGFPDGAVAQDWWMALLATAYGRVLFLNEATVLFRRHSSTTTSTKRHGLTSYFGRSLSDYRRKANLTLRQCEVFYQAHGERLNSEDKKLLAAASRIRHANWFQRRYLVMRHGFFKTGLIKNAGWLAAV